MSLLNDHVFSPCAYKLQLPLLDSMYTGKTLNNNVINIVFFFLGLKTCLQSLLLWPFKYVKMYTLFAQQHYYSLTVLSFKLQGRS